MPKRVVYDEPRTTIVRSGSPNTTLLLVTLVSLIVIAIAVVIILHVTVGIP